MTVRGLSWQINVTAIVDSDMIYATPAVADGRLYVRTASALFAFGAP